MTSSLEGVGITVTMTLSSCIVFKSIVTLTSGVLEPFKGAALPVKNNDVNRADKNIFFINK
nr:hypothetical protein [Flavobacterium covae]